MSKYVTIGSFFLSLTIATTLTYLWGLINSIQIITYLTQLNAFVPSNVASFYKSVDDL